MTVITPTKFKQTEIGLLPEGWNVLPVYELAQWINGLAFKNTHFSPTGKPVIKINELKYGVTAQTQFTEDVFDENYHLHKNDLLFSWSGSPNTSIDAFQYDLPEGWLNQHIFKVKPKESVRGDFLYYILKAHKQRFIEIARDKQTTGLGHVTLADIKRFYVALPPKDEQKDIVEILSSLDEKIELNRKINANLEKLAGSLFKKWFADIGDELPKGWRVAELKNILELNYGKALKAEDRAYGNIKVYGSSGIVGFNDKKLVDGPGIIVGRKGNVGSVFWSNDDFYAIDTTYYVKSKFPLTYCYYLLKNQTFVNSDSVVPGLNRDQAYRTEVVLPSIEALVKFDTIASDLIKSIAVIDSEIKNLEQVRDSLLPRLVSGKIRVKI